MKSKSQSTLSFADQIKKITQALDVLKNNTAQNNVKKSLHIVKTKQITSIK